MAKRGRKKKNQDLEPDQNQNQQQNQDLEIEVPFDEYSEAYYFELSPSDLKDDSEEKPSKSRGTKKTKSK
jgi:hypothetical protein